MTVDRVITTPHTEDRLTDYMIEPDHEIEIFTLDDRVDRLTLNNGSLEWHEIGREHRKTKSAECVCGFEGETIKEAEDHLKEAENRNRFDVVEIRKALKDVALHGFEFRGLDTHSNAIMFQHQELGIGFYATPSIMVSPDKGEVKIQMFGNEKTPFKQLDGMEVEVYRFGDGLTFKKYLEIVREYVEDNLIKSRWQSSDSEEYRSRWYNTFNKSHSLVIEEVEDGEEPFELYEMDGINKTLLDKGSNPEIWSKAIHYMNENPLAVVKSYKKVIQKSEYDFKGGY